jgi:hypothetical protein
MDDFDPRVAAADPARVDAHDLDRAARAAMRSVIRGSRSARRLRLTVLSTAALLAVGGGAAVAAPVVRSIFDPDVTAVTFTIVSDGAAIQCSASFETSIKLGDTERHERTMRAFKEFAATHPSTVRVPVGASREQVLRATMDATNRLRDQFDAFYPDENLSDAADVYQYASCTDAG